MEKNNSIDEEALKDSFDALFRGIFQGDLENGSMPLGQIAGLIDEIKPVKEILDDIIRESVLAYDSLSDNINKLKPTINKSRDI